MLTVTDQIAPSGEHSSSTDRRAMSITSGLFFMVGALTCLNDIVVPHLKSIFQLTYAEAMLVQFAFFSSYFVFSYPSGKLIEWLGYKQVMVVGLLAMAAGAATFLPAAYLASFPIFLAALVILASGMTAIQVAVNPFVTMIGPAETASSRLNLAQAFSSVGTFVAPYFGGLLILGGTSALSPERLRSMNQAAQQAYRETQASSVILPYVCITVVLLVLAIGLKLIRLEAEPDALSVTRDFRPGTLLKQGSIWRHPWLLAGAAGIFAYVGAEVAIGSLLINYMGLPRIAGLREQTAANYLTFYWGGAMVGRFIGSAILQRFRTGPVLGLAAAIAFCLVVGSILMHGPAAMFALLAVGLCNSIMFPSIFTLGLHQLGPLTSQGSSLMIAAIVGGAIVPLATGRLADRTALQSAFIIPAACYVYIACFGFLTRRQRNEISAPN